MPVAPTAICRPDLTERPFSLSLQRWFSPAPPHLFAAWTQHIDAWLAIPGSVLVRAEVNVPFFFETISRSSCTSISLAFLSPFQDALVILLKAFLTFYRLVVRTFSKLKYLSLPDL